MSFVARKIDSLSHRLRTEIFRRSGKWAAHPLNPRTQNLPRTDWSALHEQLVAASGELGFAIADWTIDLVAYHRFCRDFAVPRSYAVGYKDKKRLEHFIAYTLLDLVPNDVYMDVASEASPYPELFRYGIGLKVYSQDLSYPPGIRGHEVGSSADEIPLPDRSLTKMSLQCAFEHFEGGADTGFVKETARLLRSGGRCVIVPLYMASMPFNIIDPVAVDPQHIALDTEAKLIGETNLGGRFERRYSPETLRRIIVPGLRYTLYRITGHDLITADREDPVWRVRYALLVER